MRVASSAGDEDHEASHCSAGVLNHDAKVTGREERNQAGDEEHEELSTSDAHDGDDLLFY